MSSLIVSGDTSGSITLSAPAVSGSSVLTLPVTTDTLVGKATTDTLTNKTLTGAVFTAMPSTTTAQSMVRLTGSSGFGSTNTAIWRFTTSVTNQGSNITYAASATLGDTFTVNTNGVYSITYTNQFNAALWMGISLGASGADLTANIFNIAASKILTADVTGGVNSAASVTWTGYLPSTSVIMAHTNPSATAGTSTAAVNFTIARVA
jgi:hypothetical protein